MRTPQPIRGLCALAVSVAVTVMVAACQQPTAEDIVALAAAAMAGPEGIDGLQVLRVRTAYADHEYPVITEIRRPNLLRTEGVGSYVLVFDGQRGAFLERAPAEDGTPQGPELVDSTYVRDFELDIAFVFPAFFDYPAEYLGPETVEGIDTHALRVVLPLGIPVTYYVDAQTHLVLKARADVTVDRTEYHPERVYRDYERVGGIMYARSFTYSWMPDEVQTAVVESVEVNPPLPEDRFTIPADLR